MTTQIEHIENHTKHKRVLQRDLIEQFGSNAPEKLQRLFFMIRENQDVFNVFCERIVQFAYENDGFYLAEFIVHFLFLDLTNSVIDKKLTYFIYKIILNDTDYVK